MRRMDIGLSEEQRQGSIRALNTVLCDESLLLIKTKKAHWDVVGPQFLTLHKLLDEQYERVAKYVDAVAERVRSLGGFPVGTAAGFISGATVKEAPGTLELATDAVSHLLDDHEIVIRVLRDKAKLADEKSGDRGTSDFLVAILQGHEEMAWMLRSFLEGEGVVSDGRAPRAKATPSLA
jgi:starvation-inducible DNA-binding protein